MDESTDMEPGRVYLVPMVAVSRFAAVPRWRYKDSVEAMRSVPSGMVVNMPLFCMRANSPGIVATDERIDMEPAP